MRRREFIVAGCGGLLIAAAAKLRAQQGAAPPTMAGPMDGGALRPVRLPPRVGAVPLLDENAVKHLELGLKCQCGTCTKDVHVCRTTDFTCPVSPAMHRDVMALVAGGYSAQEIVDAFVDVYGEVARMAPRAEGFNIIAYAAPFVAVGTAGALLFLWITKNVRRQREMSETPSIAVSTNASDDELERLARALKDDSA